MSKGSRQRVYSQEFRDNLDDIDWSKGERWEPRATEYRGSPSEEFEAPMIAIKDGNSSKAAHARKLAENMFAGNEEKKIGAKEFMKIMRKEYGPKSVDSKMMKEFEGYNRAVKEDRGGDKSRNSAKKTVKEWKQQVGEYKFNKALVASRKVQRDIKTKDGNTKLYKK